MKQVRIALSVLLTAATLYLYGAGCRDFNVTVLLDGEEAAEYHHQGKTYIEAIKNKDYAIRITNPLSCRVAVALSVDGLNTIDAKRTKSRDASKWILDPHETIIIYGWQINGQQARTFFFTSEEKSYGAFLGKTENLGIIEAQFFKEKLPVIVYTPMPVPYGKMDMKRSEGGEESGIAGGIMQAPKNMAPSVQSEARENDLSKSAESKPKDEYAATGIGDKVEHSIQWESIDLEDNPSSIISIRYEFRPQLVKLGILPKKNIYRSQLDRREKSTGFEYSYCPDPYDRRR